MNIFGMIIQMDQSLHQMAKCVVYIYIFILSRMRKNENMIRGIRKQSANMIATTTGNACAGMTVHAFC